MSKPKSQRMRILLIDKYHRQYAGPQRLYFDTARLLRAAGHEVAFFAMQHPKNEPTEWSRYFVDEVDYEEANHLSLWQKLKVARNIIWNPQAKQNLEALIDEFKPDVAHLFVTYHQLSPSIIWALKNKNVPMVMTLCDYKIISPNYSLFVRGQIWEHASGWRCLADRCVKDSFGKSLVCAVEKWLHDMIGTYGKVDAYIGLSQFLIDTYQRLGFPHAVQLLPQPLVPLPDLSQPLPEKTGKNFLYFGRLSAEKGIATLIRAFAELHDGETLSIVGFGPEEERLKKLTTELSLEAKVKFLGPVYGDDLQKILLPAKAVVVPSEWYENTPYALLETLASGTPVIAARVGSLPERVQDGYNGFLFTPGDAHDLAEKIRKLDTVSLPMLQDNARKSVLSLDQKTYLEAVTSLYSSLIQAKKQY
ncbi:MAG: glycosyltransferase [Candidatus Moraniibacteriota bacterium]